MHAPDPITHWLRPFSLREYHQIVDAGIIPSDERVELLNGLLVKMSPPAPYHTSIIQTLAQLLEPAASGRLSLRVQLPLSLNLTSELCPDIAMVAHPTVHATRYPDTATLIIEVARDTLSKDRGLKRAIYAHAGIPEYVVVNLPEQHIEISRDPIPGSSLYGRHDVSKMTAPLQLESLPAFAIDVLQTIPLTLLDEWRDEKTNPPWRDRPPRA